MSVRKLSFVSGFILDFASRAPRGRGTERTKEDARAAPRARLPHRPAAVVGEKTASLQPGIFTEVVENERD